MAENFRNAALGFVLRKTVGDLVSAEVKGERADVMSELKKLHDETGGKSFAVKLPNGEPVATLTISQPSPKMSTDQAALLKWAEENHPEWIETIDHPAREAWTERRVSEAALKAAKLRRVGDDVITSDGEAVEGVKITTEDPSSFSVKYAEDGQRRLLTAWRAGELARLNPGENLPQLTEGAGGVPDADPEPAPTPEPEPEPEAAPTPEPEAAGQRRAWETPTPGRRAWETGHNG